MKTKADYLILIDGYKNLIKDYEKEMETAPETIEPTLSWYTICVVDWVVHIDQWLDAISAVDAVKYCKKHYGIDVLATMHFQLITWWLPVAQKSHPF